MNKTFRERVSALIKKLYRYPEPEPMPHNRQFWIATAIVGILALIFSTYFIIYLTGRHDAYMSNAEDLGIMDQAIWNTLHGHVLYQTICNTVNDTNCNGFDADGISRFAIHFEPILFPVALLYLIWSDPRMLLIIQTLIVASGAFPAFWLARLRLRNEWVAVVIAALYLLYPAQQFAVVNDFHAVTFTSAFLLFTLYFMYTRRTRWLFVFAVLSMACKEEIPLVIIMFGLWSTIFQQRWKSGLSLVGVALLWLGMYWIAVRIFSPVGHPLLSSRYDYLHGGKALLTQPVTILKEHVLETSHIHYLELLLTPVRYLPLLAPWVLLLALPSLALNMLSTDPNMYSGMYQYNAEIVPVLIFATIEAMVVIVWIVEWVIAHQKLRKIVNVSDWKEARFSWRSRRWVDIGVLALLSLFILFNAVKADATTNMVPFGQGYTPPKKTVHTNIGDQIVKMIPANASVSAQSPLAPHISHRQHIYLFPYADDKVDYVFLDVTADIYPYFNGWDYINEASKLLNGGKYGVVVAEDGYLLLKRGLPPVGSIPIRPQAQQGFPLTLPKLPASFCSFTNSSEKEIANPLNVTFTSTQPSDTLNLAGYSVAAPDRLSESSGYMAVTLYWKVQAPITDPFQAIIFMVDATGKEYLVGTNFDASFWCSNMTWKPGSIVKVTSHVLHTPKVPYGLAHIAVAILPLTHQYSTIMDVQDRAPLHILNAPGNVSSTRGTRGLQLATVTVVP